MQQVLNKISDTSFLSAYYRSVETQRQDSLFWDPFAAILAGEKGEKISQYVDGNNANPLWANAVRTRLLDRLLYKSLREGGYDTVINLACGLDTRPYRLELPDGLKWIEVDLPEVVEYKTSILNAVQPGCILSRLPCNLADLSARRELFQQVGAQSKKAIVLSEAFLPFIQPECNFGIAQDLYQIPAFSRWILDIHSPWSPKLIPRHSRKKFSQADGEIRFAPRKGTRFYREAGWETLEFHSVIREGQRLARLPGPVDRLRRGLAFTPQWMRDQLDRIYGVAVLRRD